MAKQPSKNLNFAYNSVALEDDLTSAGLNIDIELPAVTAFSDAGPRVVEGNYDYNVALGGAADFASGQSDAILFGRIGNGGAAFGFDPTGAAAAGASDPHFDSTSALLKSYAISAATGQAVTFTATLQGNSALARTVA